MRKSIVSEPLENGDIDITLFLTPTRFCNVVRMHQVSALFRLMAFSMFCHNKHFHYFSCLLSRYDCISYDVCSHENPV